MLRKLQAVLMMLIALMVYPSSASAAPEVFLQATFRDGRSALSTVNVGQTGEGFGKMIKIYPVNTTSPVSLGRITWNYTLSADEGYRFVSVTKHRRSPSNPNQWQSAGEELCTYDIAHYALAFSISNTEEDFLLKATVEFTGSTPRDGAISLSGIEIENGTILARRTTVDSYTTARTYVPISYFYVEPQSLPIETSGGEPQIGFMINPDSELGKLHRYLYSVTVNGVLAERGTYRYSDETTTRYGYFPLLKNGDKVSVMGFGTFGETFNVNVTSALKELRHYPDIRRQPEDMSTTPDIPSWSTVEFSLDHHNYDIHSVTLNGVTLEPDSDGWYVIEDINQDLTIEVDADKLSWFDLNLSILWDNLNEMPPVFINGKEMAIDWVKNVDPYFEEYSMAEATLSVEGGSEVRFGFDNQHGYRVWLDEDSSAYDTYFQQGDLTFTMDSYRNITFEPFSYSPRDEILTVTVSPASLAEYLPAAGLASTSTDADKVTAIYNLPTNSIFSLSYPADSYNITGVERKQGSTLSYTMAQPTHTVDGNQGQITLGPIIGSMNLDITAKARAFLSIESNIPMAAIGYAIGEVKYVNGCNGELWPSINGQAIALEESSPQSLIEYESSAGYGALIFFSDDYFITSAKADGEEIDDFYARKINFPGIAPYNASGYKFVLVKDLDRPGRHTLSITAIPKTTHSVKLHGPGTFPLNGVSGLDDPTSWLRRYQIATNYDSWTREICMKNSYDSPISAYEKNESDNILELSVSTGDNVSVDIPDSFDPNDQNQRSSVFSVPDFKSSDVKIYTLNQDGSRNYADGSYAEFPAITADMDIYLEMPTPDYSVTRFTPGYAEGVDAEDVRLTVIRCDRFSSLENQTIVLPEPDGSYNLAWPYPVDYYVATLNKYIPENEKVFESNRGGYWNSHHSNIHQLSESSVHQKSEGDIIDAVWMQNTSDMNRRFKLNYADDVPQFARDYIENLPLTLTYSNTELIIPTTIVNPADPTDIFMVSTVAALNKEKVFYLDRSGYYTRYSYTPVSSLSGCNDHILQEAGLDFCDPDNKNYYITNDYGITDDRYWIGGTLPDFNSNSVETISADSLPDLLPADVYSIDGRLILHQADEQGIRNLSKGIYIVGNRKITMK